VPAVHEHTEALAGRSETAAAGASGDRVLASSFDFRNNELTTKRQNWQLIRLGVRTMIHRLYVMPHYVRGLTAIIVHDGPSRRAM